MSKKLTLRQVQAACRAMGYTVKRTGCGKEMIAYPVGLRGDAKQEAGHFSDEYEDVLFTVHEIFREEVRQMAWEQSIVRDYRLPA